MVSGPFESVRAADFEQASIGRQLKAVDPKSFSRCGVRNPPGKAGARSSITGVSQVAIDSPNHGGRQDQCIDTALGRRGRCPSGPIRPHDAWHDKRLRERLRSRRRTNMGQLELMQARTA
jgi:hypothetical protein